MRKFQKHQFVEDEAEVEDKGEEEKEDEEGEENEEEEQQEEGEIGQGVEFEGVGGDMTRPEPTCGEPQANTAIKEIRQRGTKYFNQVNIEFESAYPKYFHDEAAQYMEIPDYCTLKVDAQNQPSVFGKKAPNILQAWKEALSNEEADSLNLPCLNEEQFSTFYQATMDLGDNDGQNVFDQSAEACDLIKAVTFDQQSTRKEISWLEYWVYMCAQGTVPDKSEYSSSAENVPAVQMLEDLKQFRDKANQPKEQEENEGKNEDDCDDKEQEDEQVDEEIEENNGENEENEENEEEEQGEENNEDGEEERKLGQNKKKKHHSIKLHRIQRHRRLH